VLTVAIFLVGFLAGAVAYLQLQPHPVQGGLPSTAPGFVATAEPSVARSVVDDLIKGDARHLALIVSTDNLPKLQTAIDPLVDIKAIDFVNATRLGDQALAAYIATGTTSNGQKVARGFFLRVENGKIVGVN
jgi:uncharacterized membrane protein